MTNNAQYIIVWEGLTARSIECLAWQLRGEMIAFSGHVTGVSGDLPFAINYSVQTDLQWITKQVIVNDMLHPVNSVDLKSDGKGKWLRNDEKFSNADGCIDIDLSFSAFTKTLPIKRINWNAGNAHHIQVLYIDIPDVKVWRTEQFYERLGESNFLFKATSAFQAQIKVDENGMVEHYPGIAKRIFPN
jgi:hypothetical protein